jgi:uncharacterized repeat protein (TIGR03837 family)
MNASAGERGRAPAHWYVCCRVIDNFGDAGVCWRLARQLVAEHGLVVSFFLDRLDTLARIEPSLDAHAPSQRVHGVDVRLLADHAVPAVLPDVVVEGFGCGLPAPLLEAMVAAPVKPVWINLEYLSAEAWVDGAHGLPSPHPRLPLTRFFWFPGFTPRTGGLLRERGLFARRDQWQARHATNADELRLVLFTYENAAWPALFAHWASGHEPVHVIVAEGVAAASLDAWLGAAARATGRSIVRGNLTLDIRPFTTQDGFDRWLWSADVNFVRGEDSFVRAQWAARPFVWHAYRQPEAAHEAKLAAFLARYEAGFLATTRARANAFWRAFDAEDARTIAAAWDAFRLELPALRDHGRAWADTLATIPELGGALVDFARRRL